MSMKINKSSLLASVAMLGVAGTMVAPVTVFAAGAGGDTNAPSTNPAVNPTVKWGSGGANGSIGTGANGSSAQTSGTSLAGISWHTDANSAILSLLRVPNFDFGSWKFTGGAKGAGSTNTHWYPVDATTTGPAYSSGGIAGNATYATLAADGSAPALATTGKNTVDGYNVSNSNRVLVVDDERMGTDGWKVQLSVGSFDKDGAGDGTISGSASPTGGESHLKGAAIAIVPSQVTYKKDVSNALPDVVAPVGAGTTATAPIIAYSADTRGTTPVVSDPHSTGYNYGAATTIFYANQNSATSGLNQTGSTKNGLGAWIMDFTKKESALFTSPVEGLGTYTASLKWTLTSAPQ
ncbi:WxL domain-containing protein [Xylocopilactobacillus apis]|uniref:WxL domain-containing protein n=1 Tax=Xylocopilactobacillus apis TaxID=2932183 RepID=A0AAU9D498_9LACO|nr:WxL domain-containing protein [Xylocopilactobacillus apis]BDR57296.1 hypothetical protein KIMC2_18580 [Xylocopilactobacillus apis]